MPDDQEGYDLMAAIHEAAIHRGMPLHAFPEPPEGHPLHQEWQTFKREVGRLIAAGEKGRFVIVKGDQLISIWDTWQDAAQAGIERFGTDSFLIQEIQWFVRSVRSGYSRLCPK